MQGLISDIGEKSSALWLPPWSSWLTTCERGDRSLCQDNKQINVGKLKFSWSLLEQISYLVFSVRHTCPMLTKVKVRRSLVPGTSEVPNELCNWSVVSQPLNSKAESWKGSEKSYMLDSTNQARWTVLQRKTDSSGFAPIVFLLVLQFSYSTKTNISKFQFDVMLADLHETCWWLCGFISKKNVIFLLVL